MPNKADACILVYHTNLYINFNFTCSITPVVAITHVLFKIYLSNLALVRMGTPKVNNFKIEINNDIVSNDTANVFNDYFVRVNFEALI